MGRKVLAGMTPYEPAPFVAPPVARLPPVERRRAGAAARLAIGVSFEAIKNAERDPAAMAMVFASSGGDGETVHQILSELATDRREVSPTRFHNSVHNAPAGYWAVAVGSREPSTSLCACDESFPAGLLDAAAQATVDGRPVTLAVYDLPYPEPLHTARPIHGIFATALVLTPEPTARTVAALGISSEHRTMVSTEMADPGLERLRLCNPSARALPLLAALARNGSKAIWLGPGLEVVVEGA